MTKIEKNINILKGCLPDEMKKSITSGNNRALYTKMLESILKSNRNLFITKELFYELNSIGINNPYEMSEYIIDELYKGVKYE
jgi:hypothetical protein